MQQVDLELSEFFGGDAKPAQRTEAGVDSVNGARLSGQRLHELPALANPRPRVVSQGARSLQSGGLPHFLNREFVSVERDHERWSMITERRFYNKPLAEASLAMVASVVARPQV